MDEAVFLPRGGRRYVATELARGPWDPQAQHGGAPAALLVREFELTEPGAALMLARMTFEFVRPVPLGELDVSAQVVKPGRRVQLLEGTVLDASGNEVVRARALRVGRTEVSSDSDGLARPPGPDQGVLNDYPAISGDPAAPGPASMWVRLKLPVIAGEEPTPLQRVAAAADLGNGISRVLDWTRYVFINPDLTLYAEREPAGEWICLQSQTRVSEGAVGIAESVLFDQRGQVGRATQALLVGRR